MGELLPCPFCGKHCAAVTTSSDMFPEVEDEGNAESYAVMCDASMPGGPGGCGASGGFRPTEALAMEVWNLRAALAARQDDLRSIASDAILALKTLDFADEGMLRATIANLHGRLAAQPVPQAVSQGSGPGEKL